MFREQAEGDHVVRLAAAHGLREDEDAGRTGLAGEAAHRLLQQGLHASRAVVLVKELVGRDLPVDEVGDVEDDVAAVRVEDARARGDERTKREQGCAGGDRWDGECSRSGHDEGGRRRDGCLEAYGEDDSEREHARRGAGARGAVSLPRQGLYRARAPGHRLGRSGAARERCRASRNVASRLSLSAVSGAVIRSMAVARRTVSVQ